MKNPQSTARIADHPIHPMLVPFPIVFFISALACDFAFWYTNDPLWPTFSLWLLGAGIATALLAAVAGMIDFLGDVRITTLRTAWLHAGGNIITVLLQMYSFFIRYNEGAEAVLYRGLGISLFAFVLLMFTGWYGGNMVYRYGVGVADNLRPTKTTR